MGVAAIPIVKLIIILGICDNWGEEEEENTRSDQLDLLAELSSAHNYGDIILLPWSPREESEGEIGFVMAHNENSTPRVSNQNRTEEEERGGEEEAQMEEKLLQDVMNISLFNTSDIPKTIPEEDDDVVVEFDPDEEGQEEVLIGLEEEEEPTLVCKRQEPITAQVLTQFIVSPTVDNAGAPGINVEMDSHHLPPQFRHPADLQA